MRLNSFLAPRLGKVWLATLLMLGAGNLVGQTTTGTLRGRVVNEAGEALASATVTARNATTCS